MGIDSFQLTETQIGSAVDFKGWLKEYTNAIRGIYKDKGLGKEKIQEFMGKAQGIAKYLLQNFSELQFYLGPSFNPKPWSSPCTLKVPLYPTSTTLWTAISRRSSKLAHAIRTLISTLRAILMTTLRCFLCNSG